MHVQNKLEGTPNQKVVDLVRAAGGSLTGRTRLHKTVYLLGIAGFLDGFHFEYRHYGPYSEDLTQATILARMMGELVEEERPASWGGAYSIFKASGCAPNIDQPMKDLIRLAVDSNPVALELAATAAFLALESFQSPWEETSSRKPDKIAHIGAAKLLYAKLQAIPTPNKLPTIAA